MRRIVPLLLCMMEATLLRLECTFCQWFVSKLTFFFNLPRSPDGALLGNGVSNSGTSRITGSNDWYVGHLPLLILPFNFCVLIRLNSIIIADYNAERYQILQVSMMIIPQAQTILGFLALCKIEINVLSHFRGRFICLKSWLSQEDLQLIRSY